MRREQREQRRVKNESLLYSAIYSEIRNFLDLLRSEHHWL